MIIRENITISKVLLYVRPYLGLMATSLTKGHVKLQNIFLQFPHSPPHVILFDSPCHPYLPIFCSNWPPFPLPLQSSLRHCFPYRYFSHLVSLFWLIIFQSKTNIITLIAGDAPKCVLNYSNALFINLFIQCLITR